MWNGLFDSKAKPECPALRSSSPLRVESMDGSKFRVPVTFHSGMNSIRLTVEEPTSEIGKRNSRTTLSDRILTHVPALSAGDR